MTDLQTYVKYVGRIVPTVLKGKWGERFIGVPSLILDSYCESWMQMAANTWPGVAQVAPDALAYLGEELNLPRYATETNTQYQARLARAWTDYQVAGTEASILGQLAAAGFPGGTLVYLEAESFKFRVVYPYGTHWVTSRGPLFGSGWHFGDGTYFGASPMTKAQIVTMRACIRKWKPADWVCTEVRFMLADGSYARIGGMG